MGVDNFILKRFDLKFSVYFNLGTRRVTCSDWFCDHCNTIFPSWTQSLVGKVYLYQVISEVELAVLKLIYLIW